jgi:hypothetical protein
VLFAASLEGEANPVAEQLYSVSSNGYPEIEPVEISDDELRAEIAREVGVRLGMGYDEFVEAYQEGTLPDTLAVNELVMLLRFVELSGGVRA